MIDELELIYKEKVRLNEVVNNYAASSFNDFKLLGALGSVLIVWEPISKSLFGGSEVSAETLFYVFLAINISITLIGLVNLSKHSVMNFHLEEIQILEEEIRKKLSCAKITKVFHGTDNWKSWKKNKQKRVALTFYALITFVTVFMPTFILYQNKCSASYPYIYLGFAIFLSCIFWKTMDSVHHKP